MANIIPALLIHRLRNMEDARSDEARAEKAPADDGRYNPTPVDIVIARIMLTRAKSLPPDLVDSIFDYAEYWAHSTNAINYNSENRDHLRINGSSHIENKFLVGLVFHREWERLTRHLDVAALLSARPNRHWR